MPAAPPADARHGVRDDPGRPCGPLVTGAAAAKPAPGPAVGRRLSVLRCLGPPTLSLRRWPGPRWVSVGFTCERADDIAGESAHVAHVIFLGNHATVSKRLKVIPDIPPRTRRATRRRGRRPRSRWCWGCAGASLACDTRRAGDGEGDVPPQGAGRLAWGRSGPTGAGAGRFGVSRGPTEG